MTNKINCGQIERGQVTGLTDASNVSITGGSITGITDLALADGGTGASTASGALTNLGIPTYLNTKAMAPSVYLTGATSGSTGFATADNINVNVGAYNWGMSWMWAPTTWVSQKIAYKRSGSAGAYYGYEIGTDATSKLYVILYRNSDGVTFTCDTAIDATKYPVNTAHDIGINVIRETDTVAGSIQFYVDNLPYGSAIPITAAATVTLTNTGVDYWAGTDAVRTAGRWYERKIWSRSRTAAEWFNSGQNGVPFADQGASNTPVYTSDFSAGVDSFTVLNSATLTGNVDGVAGVDDTFSIAATTATAGARRIVVGYQPSITLIRISWQQYHSGNVTATGITLLDSNGSGYQVYIEGSVYNISADGVWETKTVLVQTRNGGAGIRMYLCTPSSNQVTVGDTMYIKNITITQVGATLALLPEGIQPAPGQWLDSSGNKNHAMQPSTGSYLTRYKNTFEVRWTNTWTASSAAQYIGGFNQDVLTAKHCIDSWEVRAIETTSVQNLEGGDGSDADRFVAAFTPTAAPVNQTLANRISDGTNLKLVYTPATTATMTIETIIKGHLLE